MKKTRKEVKIKLKAIKKNPRGNLLLRALRASGLFRWEREPSKSEWVMDVLTHGIGIGLAIAGLCLLVVFAVLKQDPWAVVSTAIFGATMFALYFGSTMCHAMIGQKSESFFEVWDSVAIYALIAGTYTPFCLVNLRSATGWTLFGILWGIVAIGTYMKIKNPARQPKWIVLLYLVMGWAILAVLPQVLEKVPQRGLWFMLAGGLSYSVGILFYIYRRMKFSHTIWHLFVLGGSVSFFFAVLYGTILDF
ncbi:MAG: hemolysin III family protein [Rickettsiales bacterium]|jgi:hemolysin III|nr:hemolysin III family protein [Rickettsiales bacterium]